MFRRARLALSSAKASARQPRRASQRLRLDLFEDRTTPSYTFTTIDVPGSIETEVSGNNDAGDIVGGYRLPDNSVHAFLLSGGVYTTIDPPGSFGTAARGINNS